MDRRLTFDVKAHALLAAGDQHGFAADEARELGGGSGDLRLAASPADAPRRPAPWRFGVISVAPR